MRNYYSYPKEHYLLKTICFKLDMENSWATKIFLFCLSRLSLTVIQFSFKKFVNLFETYLEKESSKKTIITVDGMHFRGCLWIVWKWAYLEFLNADKLMLHCPEHEVCLDCVLLILLLPAYEQTCKHYASIEDYAKANADT